MIIIGNGACKFVQKGPQHWLLYNTSMAQNAHAQNAHAPCVWHRKSPHACVGVQFTWRAPVYILFPFHVLTSSISLLNLPCMQVVIDGFEAIFFLVGWLLACAYMLRSENFAVKIISQSRPTVKIVAHYNFRKS